MNAFFGLSKRSWLTSLLGTLSVALVIWLLGPLIAVAEFEPLIHERHRWIAIISLIVIWLMVQVLSLINSKRRNSATIANLAASDSSEPKSQKQASEDELRILKKRFNAALAFLKKKRLGGRASSPKFLYELPWYLVIGAPESGKTTLVKNSQLRFPLSEHVGEDAIRGVAGTRNCDWWFADEAVLIDTAGRYTMQDSHEAVDRAAWLGFLNLLRQHRPRRPINGVIITVSMADLMQQNAEQRQNHARTIRVRLMELNEQLGIRFPIYLLFTKSDLISGFTEFFSDLDRKEINQVWGITFPLSEKTDGAPEGDLGQELIALEEKLYAQVIDKLVQECGLRRRELIYKFPQQFSSQKSTIKKFTNQIVQSTPFDKANRLRGVYFTSATQEGSPIDRIMLSLAHAFGLEREKIAGFSGQCKNFFVDKLLHEVILAEAGLAGSNLPLERKRFWIHRGVCAAIGIFVTTAVLLGSTSFVRNKRLVDDLSTKTNQLAANLDHIDIRNMDTIAVLSSLNHARQITRRLESQSEESIPLSMGFGLYQGDKLVQAANTSYRRILTDALLPRLMIRLENQIKENSDNVQILHEALRVYLMLGDAELYDGPMVKAWISQDLDQNLSIGVSSEQITALRQHLTILLAKRPAPLPRPLDKKLIHWTKQFLAQASLVK